MDDQARGVARLNTLERQPTLPPLPHFVEAMVVIEDQPPPPTGVPVSTDENDPTGSSVAAQPDVPAVALAPEVAEITLDDTPKYDLVVEEHLPVVEAVEVPEVLPVVEVEDALAVETKAPRRKLSRSAPAKEKGPREKPQWMSNISVPRPGRNAIVNILILVLLAGAGYWVMTSGVLSNEVVVTSLEDGQCVQDFFTESQTQFQNTFVVQTTSCNNPHAYEVFSASNAVFGAGAYPGVEEVFAVAQEYCSAQYTDVIGGEFASSPWNVWTFAPTEDRWTAGEQTVQCLVGDFAQTEPIVGSLRGAGN